MSGMAPPASPLSVASVAQLAWSLIIIVALILLIGWFLKRLKFGTGPRGGDAAILEQISVGPRERIALVRIGNAQVLIGISAAGIVALTPLAAPIALNSGASPPPAFQERLRELMKRGSGGA